MSEGETASHQPVWSRTSRRRGGLGPLFGLLVTLLALFGALTVAMAVKERSVAAGGAVIDGWISSGVNTVKGLVGQGGDAAGDAADDAGA